MKIARELETQQKDLYFEWKNWYHNEKLNRDHCVGQKEKKNDEGVTTRPVVSCQHDICEKLVYNIFVQLIMMIWKKTGIVGAIREPRKDQYFL